MADLGRRGDSSDGWGPGESRRGLESNGAGDGAGRVFSTTGVLIHRILNDHRNIICITDVTMYIVTLFNESIGVHT